MAVEVPPPLPPEPKVDQVAGVVTKTAPGEVALDSGGPQPVPLKLDRQTAVVIDGKPGNLADIREGVVVRAAYRTAPDSGEPTAIEVVANSRPVTGRDTPPQAGAPAPAPARGR